MYKFMGKELCENVPAAEGSEELGFTQFLTYKSTLLSTCLVLLLNSESKWLRAGS